MSIFAEEVLPFASKTNPVVASTLTEPAERAIFPPLKLSVETPVSNLILPDDGEDPVVTKTLPDED